jgi:hypothetical protein
VTSQSDWHEANDQFLKTALNLLRLRLEKLAADNERAQPAHGPVVSKSGGNVRPADNPPDEKLVLPFSETENAGNASPRPALILLSRLFGLSRFEQDILLLCAGMELDTRIPLLCAQAQDDPNLHYPTYALAMALFDEPRWDALSPDRPLRHWRFIEVIQSGAQPLTKSPLRADERIVNYIKGMNSLDDRLLPFLIPMGNGEYTDSLPLSQEDRVDRIVKCLTRPYESGRIPVIELLGSDSQSKQLVACKAAEAIGRDLFRLPAELVPLQPDEMETFARLWERESILLPLALFFEYGESEPQVLAVNRFLVRSNGVFFLDVRDRVPLFCPFETFEVQKPTAAEQESLWGAGSGEISPDFAKVLAGQFNLNISSIRLITDSVTKQGEDVETYKKRIWEACVTNTRPHLDLLAQRLVPKAALQDLILPEREYNLLLEITAQVKNRMIVYDDWGFRQKMNRGFGISALFAGESGTGKTMAAEAIAHELNLDLYRIDLSQVVSKYIGETEKNLRRLFDAAEDGGAILFFDEADALFGRRSEVKDSHDRYANIEINYLLQRMEAFQGLAILATNAKGSLDRAFVRRLRFIIEFTYPGPAERKAIWERVFPEGVPREDLDLDRLARFNLTGGNIHNVALNSAFLAAHSNRKVTMRMVLNSVKTEFAKMNKPVIEAEFR